MAFEWKERYMLGIEEVDKQHKKLFEIGARAYELTRLDNAYDRYDDIMEVLKELFDYAQYHLITKKPSWKSTILNTCPNIPRHTITSLQRLKAFLRGKLTMSRRRHCRKSQTFCPNG